MAAPTQPAAPAAAAAKTKDRINVLAYTIGGFMQVTSNKPKTITTAADLYNAGLAVLKMDGKPEEIIKHVTDAVKAAAEMKLNVRITKDDEPQYKNVAADSGEE